VEAAQTYDVVQQAIPELQPPSLFLSPPFFFSSNAPHSKSAHRGVSEKKLWPKMDVRRGKKRGTNMLK
jgi:hypothetical protein